jgi:hypothetical protein
MEFFSKDDLIAAASSPQLPCEPLPLTIGTQTKQVWIQGMSGKQRDAWEASLVVGRGKRRRTDAANIRARLAVRCIFDKPGGARVFTDAEAEILGNLPAAILNPIFEMAQRLSGVGDDDIDELKKISEGEAGSDSPTSSPSS